MDKDRPWIYVWKDLVASDVGPRPTARHVALTLSLRMRPGHEVAWPSQETLSEMTGRCIKTVGNALAELTGSGWLSTSTRGRNGKRGYYIRYYARFPSELRPEDSTDLSEQESVGSRSKPVVDGRKTGNDYGQIDKEQITINRDEQDLFEKFQTEIMEADEDNREKIRRLIRVGSNNSVQESVIRGALENSGVVNSGFAKTPIFLRICREIADR